MNEAFKEKAASRGSITTATFPSMFRLRRFATLFALPLFFQFALAGKAVICVGQQDTGIASPNSGAAMPGMKMGAGQVHTVPDGSGQSRRAPCDHPFGPGGCQPLAVCAAGALVTPPVAIARAAACAHDVIAFIALEPASRTTPPELPPPRA